MLSFCCSPTRTNLQSLSSFKQNSLILRNITETCRVEKKAKLGEETDLLTPLSHRTRNLPFGSIPVIVIATQMFLNVWCQSTLGKREVWYAQTITGPQSSVPDATKLAQALVQAQIFSFFNFGDGSSLLKGISFSRSSGDTWRGSHPPAFLGLT